MTQSKLLFDELSEFDGAPFTESVLDVAKEVGATVTLCDNYCHDNQVIVLTNANQLRQLIRKLLNA